MKFIFLVLMFVGLKANAQQYIDSIRKYQEDYVFNHQVVKGEDRKAMHFFAPDSGFSVFFIVCFLAGPYGY